MSEHDPQTAPGIRPQPKPSRTARERFQAGKKTAPARPPERPPNPTRPLQPGMIHYRVAEGVLKAAQAKATEAGFALDVGQFPNPTDDETGGGNDPQAIVTHTARIVARIADRFTFLRKVSRQFEGKDARAGLLSDLAAVTVEIYRRNPEVTESLSKQFMAEMRVKKAARSAATNGGTKQPANRPTGVQ